MSRPIAAKFPGRCASTGVPYAAGALIARGDQGYSLAAIPDTNRWGLRIVNRPGDRCAENYCRRNGDFYAEDSNGIGGFVCGTHPRGANWDRCYA